MKAWIYARVSSARQEEEGYSLDAQLRICREYAATLGVRHLEEIVEVESATKRGRAGFARLLQEVSRVRGAVVIAQSQDRLARNLDDYLALEGARPEIHLVHGGGRLGTSSSNERLTSRVHALMASAQGERIGEEAKKGMAAKAALGLWPTMAPVGYVNVRREGRRVIEPDPESAPLVRQLFARCAQGESLDELTRWARAVGLRRAGAVRPLSRARIAQVLAHPIYHGVVPWGGQVYPGLHEALVSEGEWRAAREALVGRRRRARGGRRREPLPYADRLIRCACGAWVTGERKRNRRYGYVYHYYRCSGSRGPCPRGYVREEALEAELVRSLEELRLEEDVVEGMRGLLRHLAEEDARARRVALRRLRGIVRRAEESEDRSYQAYLDGQVDARQHHRAVERLRGEAAAAEEEIAELKGRRALDADLGVGLLELAQGASEVLRRVPPPVRRELLRFFLRDLVLEPDSGSVGWRLAPLWGALNRTTESRTESGVKGRQDSPDAEWLSRVDEDRTHSPLLELLLVESRPWMAEALTELRAA